MVQVNAGKLIEDDPSAIEYRVLRKKILFVHDKLLPEVSLGILPYDKVSSHMT
jgi:hypothetical protein